MRRHSIVRALCARSHSGTCVCSRITAAVSTDLPAVHFAPGGQPFADARVQSNIHSQDPRHWDSNLVECDSTPGCTHSVCVVFPVWLGVYC